MRLLTAFYFRQAMRRGETERFEFTHKSFGEYLAARHIVATLEELSEEGLRSAATMADADGLVVVTFNGEIYNYRELKARFAAEGFNFRTQSDTEVILAAWLLRGEAGLDLLEGMRNSTVDIFLALPA